MNEISAKFKRQIEIIGIAINNTKTLTTDDLAQMYCVEQLTIKRDLQELRSNGFDIHSEGKKGIRLSGKLDHQDIANLVSSYLTLSSVGTAIDKASQLLTKKLGIESLNIAVTLQRCIEESVKVKISYESEQRKDPSEFTVEPLQIFQTGGLWRLLALHDNTMKQFLLTKIVKATITHENFISPQVEQINEIFDNSFLAWTGKEKYTVRLKLSKQLARQLMMRQLIMFKIIKEKKDNTVIVEGVVNSLEEIARWIVGLGEGVEAISPFQLRLKVKTLANAVFQIHCTTYKSK